MTPAFLTGAGLRGLRYDKVKATVALVPEIAGGRLTFRLEKRLRPRYAFADAGRGSFVPCFVVSREVSKMTFAEDMLYESVRSPRDFGTYENVPKVLPAAARNSFRRVPGRIPSFEGYFDSAWAADAALPALREEILGRVLPFERVRDEALEREVAGMSFAVGCADRDDEFDDYDESLETGED